VVLLTASISVAQPPPPHERPAPTPTSEGARLGAEYVVQRAGAHWTYQWVGGGRGRMSVDRFSEWKAFVSYSLGKASGSTVWRVRDGAWVERNASRGPGELLVLPALISVGTRWSAPASLERGGKGPATWEVLALDASVELPRGITVDHCLAVLETSSDGQPPFTHYFAPNMGKVAVRGPDDWVALLSEFRAGGRGHQE